MHSPTPPQRRSPAPASTLRRPGGLALTALCALALTLSGCATQVRYVPRVSSPGQTLKHTQGVGTLTVEDRDQAVFMYPTFRLQDTRLPTFTLGFANHGAEALDFSPDNVKAFFRGQPVPVYSYTERMAEIESERRGQQIALAILGGLAMAAAVHAGSRQSYSSQRNGFMATPNGLRSFSHSSSMRVYDPVGGILAGAVVGGATVAGIRQLDYNAQTQAQSAAAMLQLNTVEPLHMVTGDLVLRDCCDPSLQPDDSLRFEVSARDKTYVFEFARQKLGR